MLQLFGSGLICLWLDMAGASNSLSSEISSSWQDTPWIVLPGDTDSAAVTTLKQYLKELSTKGLAEKNQGVWLQSGPMLLADHQGTTPLPAASLTKIATSLVALKIWGPQYQFETLVSATGPVQNGVLQGDLVVEGTGDPFFVWEEAIALGNALNRAGVTQVTGNLVITGRFAMNYEVDATQSGNLLKQGLDSKSWTEETELQYSALPPGTPRPQVTIAGSVQVTNLPFSRQILLVRHRSLPLSEIIKSMNIFSNNAIAEMLAQSVGGAVVVAQQAALIAGVPQPEVQLINGSGLGSQNRISPRAICSMLVAIQRYLQPYNLTVADLFPIAGRDGGTVEYRKIPANSAVKTGTLADVSALAGVMPTRDRGLVWFAILNRGNDLDGLRTRQDTLLQNLSQQWGSLAVPPIAITPKLPTHAENAGLGDPNRIQIVQNQNQIVLKQ